MLLFFGSESSDGRSFHTVGVNEPTLHWPKRTVRERGSTMSPWSADRSRAQAPKVWTGTRTSSKYPGPWPRTQSNAIRANAGAPAANVTCHAHHRHFSLSMNRTSRQLKQQHSQCTTSTSTRFLSSCFYFHINLYSYTCSMLVMNLLSFIVDNHFTLSNQISALTKSILFTYS